MLLIIKVKTFIYFLFFFRESAAVEEVKLSSTFKGVQLHSNRALSTTFKTKVTGNLVDAIGVRFDDIDKSEDVLKATLITNLMKWPMAPDEKAEREGKKK